MLDKHVDGDIDILKMKKSFNQVNWNQVREVVELKEFKQKFNVAADEIDGVVAMENDLDNLELLNDKLKANTKKSGPGTSLLSKSQ